MFLSSKGGNLNNIEKYDLFDIKSIETNRDSYFSSYYYSFNLFPFSITSPSQN